MSREVVAFVPPVTSKKNQALLKQYPFLQEILTQTTASFDDVETTLNIVVERGDANLLYRAANNHWGENSSITSPHNREFQGKRLECYYPVDTDGQLGSRRHWDERRQVHGTRFVKDVFEHSIRDWQDTDLGENPYEVVDCIAWVTLVHLYSEEGYHSGTQRPDKREVWITLYREPKQGWKRLVAYSDVFANVRLSGSYFLDGLSINDRLYELLSNRAVNMAMQFEIEVVDQGLSAFIYASDRKGMSGVFGTVEVRSYVTAGRVMITLERNDVSFTLIGVADFSHMRLACASIDGTFDEAGRMIADAAKFWQALNESERSEIYKDDEKVNLGF